MNYAELGQKVKAKYSEYGSLSDEDVGRRVAAKYPEYEQQITDRGNAVTNFLPSLGRNLGDMLSAVTHPVDTVKSLGTLALSVTPPYQAVESVNKLLGGQDMAPTRAKQAVGKYYADRYGGLDKIGQTVNQDPAGFLLDLSTLLDGGGSLAAKSGTLSKVAGLEKAARTVQTTGKVLDPINDILALTSKGLKGTTKLTKPFTNSIDTGVVKTANELGVELPLSATTDSNVLKFGEAVAQKGIFGDKLRQQISGAYKKLDDLTDEVTLHVVGDADLKGTGQAIQKGFDTFKTGFHEQKTRLYDSIPNEVMTSQAQTDNTLKALDEIIAQKGQSLTGGQNIDFYKRLRNRIAPVEMTETPQSLFPELTAPQQTKPATINQLKATRSEIGARLKGNDPVVTGDRATMSKLYAALSDDIDTSIKTVDPQAGQALDEANAFYRSNIEKINSALGRKIQNSDPEKLVENIVKPNSETTVDALREIIGEEGFAQVQESFFQRLFEKSVNKRTGKIELGKLQTQLDRYGKPTINKILSPEQQARLDGVKERLGKLDRLDRALRSGTKAADGSQTAFLGEIGGMVGMAAFNPAILAKYLVGRAALASLFSTKMGRNLLTQGIDLGTPASKAVNTVRGAERGVKFIRGTATPLQDDRMEGLRRAKARTDAAFRARPTLLP